MSSSADVAQAQLEFAEAISVMSTSSDLSKQLSQVLGVLSDVCKKAEVRLTEQSTDDMITILGTGWCYFHITRDRLVTCMQRANMRD